VASVSGRAASASPALPFPRHEGYRAGEPGYRRIAVALFAAGVATFALLYSTQALLPVLARAFSLSAGQSTLSLSLATAGLGAALLVTGPISEMLGRTRLIQLSLMASGLVASACALAPSWDVLLGLRLVQGITLAGLPAVATAYLREETHPSTYSRAAGLYIGGTALGGLTGRLVTGAVADAAGWRWALAAIAAVGLACAAIVLSTLPPSRNFTPAPVRAGQLAAMVRRAVSDPGLLALYALGGCSMGAFVTTFNAMGFRLTAAPFHFSAGAVGLVFLVYPVGSLSSSFAGRMAGRFSRRTVVPANCLLAAAGVLVTLPGSLPAIVVGLAMMTAGFFGMHGVVSGWVPARAHAGGVASGQAASLYLFAYYLGSSVFGTLAGPAWSLGEWPTVAALTLALFLACGLLLARLWHIPSLDKPGQVPGRERPPRGTRRRGRHPRHHRVRRAHQSQRQSGADHRHHHRPCTSRRRHGAGQRVNATTVGSAQGGNPPPEDQLARDRRHVRTRRLAPRTPGGSSPWST
jgi:MFS transporter, YNFM family, putative membrane transport protein